MTEQTFAELDKLKSTQGPAAAIDHLVSTLREGKLYHKLFDSLLMKKKHELGLPLTKPTSFDDVPEDKRDIFEQAYVTAAREVGEALLGDNSIAQAWMYLRTIREPQKIAAAIEALPSGRPAEEEILDIAFFQGVTPVKGLELLLSSHGTCSTITALDQHFAQLKSDIRTRCAAMMVRHLYDSLRDTLQSEVQRRQAMTPPGQSIKELIAGRDWLFADDNYHVDVSHLNAVVRFARALDATCPEFKLAQQLALYGSRLAQQYQYAGNAPFDDFYPAHIQFLKALSEEGREEGLAFFHEKLKDDPTNTDNQLTAVTLVDLLQRVGRRDEALELACQHLAGAGEEFGVSLPDLCAEANRFDKLMQIAKEQGDVISYTAALVQQG